MPDHNNDYLEFSTSVQEIITDIPPWIIRWGISLFLIIICMFLILASWISMPDIVHGTVTFESEVPPEQVMCTKSGKLVKLFVKENSVVDSGDVLGFMQSTANHEDVLTLSKRIDSVCNLVLEEKYDILATQEIENFRHLGELQVGFREFFQSFISFRSFLLNGYYLSKKKSLERELKNIDGETEHLKKQLALQEQGLRLSSEDFEAFKKLHDRKVVSEQEFREQERKLINNQLPLAGTRSAINSNNLLSNQKKDEVLALQNQIRQERIGFLSMVNKFISELDDWKRQFVLSSFSKGRIIFNDRIIQGKWLNADKPAFYIEPISPKGYVGRLKVGQFSFGKIKEGQIVLLKLDAYPYQEFGMLKGKIGYLPNISTSDSSYFASVVLTNGNSTTYNKNIILNNGLKASAEVVTKKKNMLSKLFYNVYSIFKNKV